MLREAAEYPNSFIPLGPGDERIETERYTLCMAAPRGANTVQRQRFGDSDVDDVLAEVRSRLRERGRTRTQWEIGSAAEPAELAALLLERGLVLDSEPFAVALALDSAPPAPPAGLVARRVRTFEEYVAAHEVQWEAFGSAPEKAQEYRAALPERWESAPIVVHAAWLDGELVSAGTCAPTPHGLALFGGATLARARRRGAYRALIHARWDEATATGAPALITQAGAMSRPILERLGFATVGRIEMLIDEFGAPGA